MKKYDSYKDSGIEWIGEIPSHWKSWKISHAFNRIGSGTTPESGNSIYHENGTINWLNTGDLNDGFLDTCSKKITQKALEDYSSLKLFPAGSLVMAMYGATIGKTAILNFETTTNQACCVFCESEIINLRFLQYWFIGNKEQIINLAIGGGQPNISQNILKDIRLWCPDYSEQLSLNKYLDHKTTQIDDLIAKKERLIQLLEEERTAIINQAVTKGLDPTVPMKDSGIEWLGEIPEHWDEARIKNVTNIVGRIGFRGYTTADLVQKGEGAISLSPSNIKNHVLNIDDCTYLSWEKYHESPEIKIFENDIILVKTGSTIGKTAIIPSGTPEMTLNPQLVVLKDVKLNPLFLYYMMVSNYFQGYFSVYTAGGSTPAISQEKINNFKITFPSELEQLEISNFISQKESEIKRIISKTQLEIELLKEYKTALISEVVTGKVDVREEKIN